MTVFILILFGENGLGIDDVVVVVGIIDVEVLLVIGLVQITSFDGSLSPPAPLAVNLI